MCLDAHTEPYRQYLIKSIAQIGQITLYPLIDKKDHKYSLNYFYIKKLLYEMTCLCMKVRMLCQYGGYFGIRCVKIYRWYVVIGKKLTIIATWGKSKRIL